MLAGGGGAEILAEDEEVLQLHGAVAVQVVDGSVSGSRLAEVPAEEEEVVDVDDLVDAEVAVDGLVASEGYGLVCVPHVRGGSVTVGVDGHAREPHVTARPHDADGNFPAVGNENLHRELVAALGFPRAKPRFLADASA